MFKKDTAFNLTHMHRFRKISNVLLSLMLGGAILYWMYRDFDFQSVKDILLNQMNWWWMLASFPFCVMAQMFRGWRWKQSLDPLGEHAKLSNCFNAVFVSYAASLVIPRIGEFTRCGILTRKDGVSFAKSLGTVVTERIVDTLVLLVIILCIALMQLPVMLSFFSHTGTRFDAMLDFFGQFSTTGYIVTLICGLALCISMYLVRKRIAFYSKIRNTIHGLKDGMLSVRKVHNLPLYIMYSVGIWVAYFLHYYLTFFCFQETAALSLSCALVSFAVGCIAVLVPTPNGAGSWHFAVKTVLIIYGVSDPAALFFVLIVHSVQTLMVILLGIYGWLRLSTTNS